ncbi:MAG: aspartate racemase [Chloroflexota bacterium]|nr:MAG: aspartate racemase [Chloroflexota bacterium]
MNEEKIVGILGGMGPFTTIDFFHRLVSMTPARKDWEHLRIIIDNNVKIPSRTRAILYNEASPVPGMIESINNLASIGADFVTVPCNSAHHFYPQVADRIRIPWLNMIEIVSQVVTNNKSRPLVLGGYVTLTQKTYSKYIPEAVYPLETDNDIVWSAIEEIKLTNVLCPASKSRLEAVIQKMSNEIDSILLACTEFSIAYEGCTNLNGLKIIDSSTEYAKATINFAKKINKLPN